MIGGHMKSSFVALVAIAGLAGGMASAQAADLGGDCCADLEERVAELEATTARKGNRKVSLTVSGWVNEAVLFWDDGVEQNAYQVTNLVAQSRFRFVGSAKINADWSAGYLLELGVHGANSSQVTADTDDGGGPNAVGVRHSAWWLQSKQLGKLWVGQTSSATDAITEINLANTLHFATQNASAHSGGFAVRTPAGVLTDVQLRQFMGGNNNATGGNTSAQIGEGERFNVVKYETPTFAGFAMSVSAGEDDMWDVALRYAGEFSGFKIAAGVGYMKYTDLAAGDLNCATLNAANNNPAVQNHDCQQFGASGAIMHVPTGLYVHAAYGQRSDDNLFVAGSDDTSTQLYIQGGIEQNFFGIGKTTLFGEYQRWDIGSTVNAAGVLQSSGREMTMWGIGFNQAIDAAAMDLYVRYNNFDAECTAVVAGGCHTGGAAGRTSYQEFQTIMAGGKINF